MCVLAYLIVMERMSTGWYLLVAQDAISSFATILELVIITYCAKPRRPSKSHRA